MTVRPWIQKSTKPIPGSLMWWLSGIGSRSQQNNCLHNFQWSRIYLIEDVKNSPGQWKIWFLGSWVAAMVFMNFHQDSGAAKSNHGRPGNSQKPLGAARNAQEPRTVVLSCWPDKKLKKNNNFVICSMLLCEPNYKLMEQTEFCKSLKSGNMLFG